MIYASDADDDSLHAVAELKICRLHRDCWVAQTKPTLRPYSRGAHIEPTWGPNGRAHPKPNSLPTQNPLGFYLGNPNHTHTNRQAHTNLMKDQCGHPRGVGCPQYTLMGPTRESPHDTHAHPCPACPCKTHMGHNRACYVGTSPAPFL